MAVQAPWRTVVPDLASTCFQLMGGRLLPAEDGSRPNSFRERKGNYLTLYLRVDVGGETAFRDREDDGIGAFYWSNEGFGYAIAANADRAQLLQLAAIVYRQTAPDGARARLPPAPGKASGL